MFPLTVSQLKTLINGRCLQGAATDQTVTGGEIDSRRIQHGHAFFALPGSQTHGFAFADAVINAGASCIVVDHSLPDSLRAHCQTSDRLRIPVIEVDDCRSALWTLATWNRSQSTAVLVAVTGSVGKTTTRQLIHRVLSSGFAGIESPASFNNELGVPLSLLLLEPKHEFGVLELGANAPGEIRRLAQLVKPEVSVVTRVAEAHLEGFGDLDGVRRAKQELVEETLSSGMVFLNADDDRVTAMSTAARSRVLTFGSQPGCDYRFCEVSQDSAGLSFRLDAHSYQIPAAYRHLTGNVAAAVAIGLTLGLTPDDIQRGLQSFRIPGGRGNVIPELPWTVIDDSYNASPASVIAAAKALSEQPTSGHRILVLGDMLELGPQSASLHYELGLRIARQPIDHVLIFGSFAEHLSNGIRAGLAPSSDDVTATSPKGQRVSVPIDQRIFENHVSVYSDISTLCTMLECLASTGDTIWIKGSRGSAMERVIKHLIELAQSTPSPRRAA